MKHPFRSNILPYFTMGAAGLGFVLRLWLFSAVDEKGLLPANHPAGALLFLLSAAVIGILFLATRKPGPGTFSKLPRVCFLIAGALSCIGLVYSALTKHNAIVDFSGTTSRLTNMAVILGFLGGLLMLFMGILDFRRNKYHYFTGFILTICLMVETVSQCRVWGAEPQLQVYFFPLMASVFLLLTAYQKTMLLARKAKRSTLAFFSQAAAYFCCLSFNSFHKVFYCGMFLWAALQIYACLPRKKEA